MLLSYLLKILSEDKEKNYPTLPKDISNKFRVTGIVDDSRKAFKDCCFVAIKGITKDGHDHICEAIKKGAKVIVAEDLRKNIDPKKTVFIKVSNSRRALSYLASAWYGNPSRNIKFIGITGTKGKTTTAYILFQILKRSGFNVGLISSIGAYYKDVVLDTGLHVTNPEPLVLHKILFEMVSEGIDHVVLEVTSHGLDQERTAGIYFDYAILTNIAPEHLDYHKTIKRYMNAKLKLFLDSAVCILNKDDVSFNYFRNRLESKKIITYSQNTQSEYNARIRSENNTLRFQLHTGKDVIDMKSNLMGSFNLYNTLPAIIVALELGIPIKTISTNLKVVQNPPGRLEKIDNKKGIDIFIDFAHTPDSLKSVLNYFRIVKKGKLIIVFGSAGDRDRKKRPFMGKVASKLADIAILTAEDPRSEDVYDIIDQIEKGIVDNSKSKRENRGKMVLGKDYFKIPDRGEAIFFALNKIAKTNDLVVICGKGREESMCYGNAEYPWSDREAINLALKGSFLKIDHEKQ